MRLFYDRNIRNIRAIVIVLGVVNVAIFGVNIWKRNWLNAAVSGVWTVNMAAALYVLREAQVARDEVRVLLAGLHQEEPK